MVRDIALFIMGALGLAVLFGNWAKTGEKPPETLVLLVGALLGLPVFLKADERRTGGNSDTRDRGEEDRE